MGFTLVELVFVLTILGVLLSLAMPPIGRMRSGAALQNGRAMVGGAFAVARSAASQWGAPSQVVIDSDAGRVDVFVDTTATASDPTALVVRTYRISDDLGVSIRADRERFCFDAQGVGTSGDDCAPGRGSLILTFGADEDTLIVNAVGRIVR